MIDITKPTLKLLKTIQLGAVVARKTSECFMGVHWWRRHSDIDWWLPENQSETPATVIAVYGFVERQTLLEMSRTVLKVGAEISSIFDISRLLKERRHVLTLSQYDALVEKQQAGADIGLCFDGCANFAFVEKKNGSVAVACVNHGDSGWNGHPANLLDGSHGGPGDHLLICNSETLHL